MALLFADGFEDGTAAWTLGTSMTVGTGRFGNGLAAAAAGSYAETGFPATAGPIMAGFAVKPAGTGGFAGICNTAGTNVHVTLSRGAGGELIAYRQTVSNVLGSSASGVLPASAWSFVEMRVTISNTTGTVVVNVNGVQVLNLSALDTQETAATASVLRLGAAGINGTTATAWDDVYIADTTGTYNTTFLGENTVEHLRPASDDTAQWVGSDGNSTNNYDLVNESGTYDGADFVASATVGQRDLYVPAPSSLPISSPVLGVVVSAVAMKTDAGTRTAKLCVKEGSGGTVRQGPDTGLPASFGEIRAVFERKGDGTQFTVADVNALRVGIEVAT